MGKRQTWDLLVLAAVLLVVTTGCGPAFGSSSASLQEAAGVVVKIVDGDTFTIHYTGGGAGLPTEIRPYLLNAPETKKGMVECYGSTATEEAGKLLQGQKVWLEHVGKRSRERLLAFVYLDPEHTQPFATAMIAGGHARLDARHPEEALFVDELNDLQLAAQKEPLGLWKECAAEASPPPTNVVINEVEANPPGNDAGNEWVELYNPTDETIDLSGWRVVADREEPSQRGDIAIGKGRSIGPKAFLVLQGTGQVLDNRDEFVELLDAGGEVVDRTRALSDEASDLRCRARVPDGDGWEFQTCTPGKSNGKLRFDPRR